MCLWLICFCEQQVDHMALIAKRLAFDSYILLICKRFSRCFYALSGASCTHVIRRPLGPDPVVIGGDQVSGRMAVRKKPAFRRALVFENIYQALSVRLIR